ncbi:MAG: hypothetical protein U0074_24480 [Kouleothrix sp.]
MLFDGFPGTGKSSLFRDVYYDTANQRSEQVGIPARFVSIDLYQG